jgi:hypothetical protein
MIRSRKGRAVKGPDGTEYPSVNAAARAMGFHSATLNHHLRRYGNLDLLGCGSIPCEYQGKRYASLMDLAKAIGVARHTLTYHLNTYGNFEKAGQGTRRGNPGNKGRRRPITIGPLHWDRCKDAAEELGISATSFSRWTGPNATPRQREKLLVLAMQAQARRHSERRAAA